MTNEAKAIVRGVVEKNSNGGAAVLSVEEVAALNELLKELEDYDISFELYDTATRALTKAWQQAHPETEAWWPDTAKLCEWTANKLSRMEWALEQIRDRALIAGEQARVDVYGLAKQGLEK